MDDENAQILIVEMDSQYGYIIQRRVREQSVSCIVLKPLHISQWLDRHRPKGIIISGGNGSVCNERPSYSSGLDSALFKRVPILGICYGMQWLTRRCGGKVDCLIEKKEFGPTMVQLNTDNPLFTGIQETCEVWMSHSDSVLTLPRDYIEIATSQNGVISGIHNPKTHCWGVQFHPEVVHTLYFPPMSRQEMWIR